MEMSSFPANSALEVKTGERLPYSSSQNKGWTSPHPIPSDVLQLQMRESSIDAEEDDNSIKLHTSRKSPSSPTSGGMMHHKTLLRSPSSSNKHHHHHRPTSPSEYRSLSHIIGYAPEGTTSTCKSCGRGFKPKKLRFGTFFAQTDGSIILRWHHFHCIRPPESLEDVQKLTGYKELMSKDMEKLHLWMQMPMPLSPTSSPSVAGSSSPSPPTSPSSVATCSSSPRPQLLHSGYSLDDKRRTPVGSRSSPGGKKPVLHKSYSTPPIQTTIDNYHNRFCPIVVNAATQQSSDALKVVKEEEGDSSESNELIKVKPPRPPPQQLQLRISVPSPDIQQLAAVTYSPSPTHRALSPHSSFMLDTNLPSPSEMLRRQKERGKIPTRHNTPRDFSPPVSFTFSSSSDALISPRTGIKKGNKTSANNKKTSFPLKMAAKAERSRIRSQSI